TRNERKADELLAKRVGLSSADRELAEELFAKQWTSRRTANWFTASKGDSVSYWLGCSFGRWDIQYATDEKAMPELPDPFAPLPVCPLGMLRSAEDLPAGPEDVPAAYPIRIPWDGILVDDPNHPLDIERRLREVLEIIWKDRAESIERGACE